MTMTDKQMSIAYINAMGPTDRFPHGGVFVTQRIRALQKKNVNVIPIALGIEYTKLVDFILKKKGVETAGKLISQQIDIIYDKISVRFGVLGMFFCKYVPKAYEIKIYKRLAKRLKAYQNVDLIHLHWIWPVGLGVKRYAKKYKIPYIITCHGSEINVTMKNIKIRKYIIEILENAEKVEFISNALLQSAMLQGYSGKNAIVVYNGIDTEIFCKKKFTKGKKKIVGYVGNLLPVKGADRLPEIFNELYNIYGDDIEFIVIGTGRLMDELKEKMNTMPVVFAGRLSPEYLAEEYAKMDVLVVPSRSEGYSCVIKEAQACGVIPIGNNVGGIPEAIGKYGILVDSKDEKTIISDFASAIERCLSGEVVFNVEEMISIAGTSCWNTQIEESIFIYKEIVDYKGGR